MFESLSEQLSKIWRNISGKFKITENNIKQPLNEVRKAFLDADVEITVVKSFIDNLKAKILGTEIDSSFSPDQFFIKLVKEYLIEFLGATTADINLKAQAPIVILMAGLQGSGKTTTVGKLAKYLQEQHKKSVMVTSCDIYRPAAILQLETIANSLGIKFCPSSKEQSPVAIAKNAVKMAKQQGQDILIVDTAGRLHIDEQMMAEVAAIHEACKPTETLFVVDSMTGQDAAVTAKVFDKTLALTGVVLTKIDGDARGGAALSIRHVTGKPIKFLGVGEKLDALEPFHPERIASRILGMGDMLSLIEEIERKVDKTKAEKLSKKLSKGNSFDLEDFRQQIMQMKKIGSMTSMLDKLPTMGMGAMLGEKAKGKFDDESLKRILAVLDSMTLSERLHPALAKKNSRKVRIAKGAGVETKDVNNALKQHEKMQKMIKKFSGNKMQKMMQAVQQQGNLPAGGALPPGLQQLFDNKD